MILRERTCCFTGHRPSKLPWGNNERDPRCLVLKREMAQAVREVYQRGFRCFLSGMARGCDLFFCEAVLELGRSVPDVVLEAAVPCPGQERRWSEREQARYHSLLMRCDRRTLVSLEYTRDCMHRRNRYMVDRSALVIAAYDGSPGGTRYTLDYAARQGRDRILLPVG